MAEPHFEDPIEWVGHFWRKQQLGDPSKFMALGSLMRLQQIVTQELDRALKPFGLTRTGYLVLATVQLSPDGTRLLSRIATHMLVHPTTITLVVDKLEEQGLLVRQAHPTDRRATYARITPAGTALMKEASRALDKVGFGMPGLTNTQARELIEALSPIREQAGDAERRGEGRASRVS